MRFRRLVTDRRQDIHQLRLARVCGRGIEPEMTVARKLLIQVRAQRPQSDYDRLPSVAKVHLTGDVREHFVEELFTGPFLIRRNCPQSWVAYYCARRNLDADPLAELIDIAFCIAGRTVTLP